MVLVALFWLLGLFAASSVSAGPAAFTSASGAVRYVVGSTQEVCQLTGQKDYETGLLTSSETKTRYGLTAADGGSSFIFDGKLWWLFGDAIATRKFRGTLNTKNRYPASGVFNDAMAYSSLTTPPGTCPTLDFVPQPSKPGAEPPIAAGAFTNPTLWIGPKPTAADPAPPSDVPVSLRTNESAAGSGIEVNGQMYVVFKTGNEKTETGNKSLPSVSTESVMGELVTPGTLRFEALYDLSAPKKQFAAGAKFVEVALAASVAGDGYIYIWGAGPTGAGQKLSAGGGPLYLARMQASAIAGIPDLFTAIGQPPEIDYYAGVTAKGTPNWVSENEGAAVGLFSDKPADCMHTFGVQWNQYVGKWVVLYDCKEADPPAGLPNGIYMRTAAQPWGPWSSPQTIFNPQPNKKAKTGYCYFIYQRRLSLSSKCPNNSNNPQLEMAPSPGHGSKTANGTFYGPHFVANWTSGHFATESLPATSTFYYTLDTFWPYGQVILQSTIEGPSPPKAPPKPGPPTCKGTTCM
jgi:hypothetical protein